MPVRPEAVRGPRSDLQQEGAVDREAFLACPPLHAKTADACGNRRCGSLPKSRIAPHGRPPIPQQVEPLENIGKPTRPTDATWCRQLVELHERIEIDIRAPGPFQALPLEASRLAHAVEQAPLILGAGELDRGWPTASEGTAARQVGPVACWSPDHEDGPARCGLDRGRDEHLRIGRSENSLGELFDGPVTQVHTNDPTAIGDTDQDHATPDSSHGRSRLHYSPSVSERALEFGVGGLAAGDDVLELERRIHPYPCSQLRAIARKESPTCPRLAHDFPSDLSS